MLSFAYAHANEIKEMKLNVVGLKSLLTTAAIAAKARLGIYL